MEEKEIWWKCSKCSTKNWASYDDANELKRKIFSCCMCGKAHRNFEVQESDKNWLSCIPFESSGTKIPSGVSIEADSGDVFWGDPNGGDDLDRAHYTMKYGYDPWILFCNQSRNKDNPVCIGFEDRCKMRRTEI